jgi:NAD(P)-dependent dehydrogenase (short-subunit alcohol dehydrogenase family)
MADLDGRVALVTGGGGAIGAAICRTLGASGAVVVVADIREDAARVVADALPPGRARALRLDVTDSADWDEAVRGILARERRLDILVNNAATHVQSLVETMTDEDWSRVIHTNADSVFFGCRAAIRAMRDGGKGGAVVNVVTGQFGVPYSSAYTSSKFLVQGFSKCLALEVARYGIRVNTIAPGVVPNTGFERWYRQKAEILGLTYVAFMAAALDSIPLHAFGTPEDVAAGVAYLVSDRARYVTGHLLDVDGGFAGYQISIAPEGGWLDNRPPNNEAT